MSISLAAVCFIALHGGPADHFSAFAEELVKKGHDVQIYASGPALKKFQDRHFEVVPFVLENLSEAEAAVQLARQCAEAEVVITDVGHVFDIALQKALKEQAPKVLRWAYYDNPEPYVPGGYSATAAKVMRVADGVLFANANLVKTAVFQAPSEEVLLNKRVGVGYYPIAQAEKIAQRRAADREKMRAEFFSKYSLVDKGQKVLVYAGGNNDEYFSKAFPAFLHFLNEIDLSDFLIVLQQHPGAKQTNLDGLQVLNWLETKGKGKARFIVSELSSDEIQVIADSMLYYQTSMGPQFVLAGIPTIQVGHNVYEDILVKNGLCSVATDPKGLELALMSLQNKDASGQETIRQDLGIYSDWAERLEQAILTKK